jgi:hypothetical protein
MHPLAGEHSRPILVSRKFFAMPFTVRSERMPGRAVGNRNRKTSMKTEEIAQRLVALCREARWETAQRELYSPDVVSLEPHATPVFEKETRGLPNIIEKGRKSDAMIETMHALTVSDPVVAGSSFACTMQMDVTMKGQGRMNMTELCVYHVKDGKVVSEEFLL